MKKNSRLFLICLSITLINTSTFANKSTYTDSKICSKATLELLNLTYKMKQEFKQGSSANSVMSKYKSDFEAKVSKLDEISKTNPECSKEFQGAVSEAVYDLKEIQNSLKKDKNVKASSNSTTYDEWFTMQSTGIKSGKKYTFKACVNGPRNATAIKCNTPGSAAKRVFYSTDDIKTDAKSLWINTVNQEMCVTAYVTGHQAYVYDVKEKEQCE